MSTFSTPRDRILLGEGVASLTGTTSETVMGTVAIPAGFLGNNGELKVDAFSFGTNSANNKTVRIKHGAASGSTVGTAIASASSTTGYSKVDAMLLNDGAANVQATTAGTSYSGVGTTLGAGAIDTSAASYINITGQLALGTETMKVRWHVYAIPRP